MPQKSVPCVVYRGGTSRGLFFHKQDLPNDIKQRNEIFLQGIDAWNLAQVDGLGGGTSSTSKVCVIAPPSRPDAHADWTFYQLGVADTIIDEKGTCGNLMSSVGAFVVDEGLVAFDKEASCVEVRVYNTNIKKMLCIQVPLVDGMTRTQGTYAMPGVIKSGALLDVSIVNPAGGMFGEQLAYGKQSKVFLDGKAYKITISDLINPFVFVSGADFELQGSESLSSVAVQADTVAKLNAIRDQACVLCGLAQDEQEAKKNKQNVPKIAIISPAQDYITTGGELIKKADVDLLIKVISMGKFHRTSPASGLYNLAATAMLADTIPNLIAGFTADKTERIVRIGHPEGVVEIKVVLSDNARAVYKVGMQRTVRRIIKGELFYQI